MEKRILELNTDENKLLFDLVKKRQAIADRAIAIQDEFKKLEEELKKKEHEMNRLQDKSRPIVEKFGKEWDLKEFEAISGVFIEDEKLCVHVADQIEDFKEMIREQRKKQKEVESGEAAKKKMKENEEKEDAKV